MSTTRKVIRQTPLGVAEVIVDLFSKSKTTPVVEKPAGSVRVARARRAGLFRVPSSISGPPNEVRKAVAERFKSHLRGVSGANRLGADPDESVMVVKRDPKRGLARPGFGFRRVPSPDMDDDEE